MPKEQEKKKTFLSLNLESKKKKAHIKKDWFCEKIEKRFRRFLASDFLSIQKLFQRVGLFGDLREKLSVPSEARRHA